MSGPTKDRLESLALYVGLALSVAAAAKVWFIMPDKVEQQGVAIVKLQARAEADREVLLKLSWQYEQITKDLTEIKAAVKRTP